MPRTLDPVHFEACFSRSPNAADPATVAFEAAQANPREIEIDISAAEFTFDECVSVEFEIHASRTTRSVLANGSATPATGDDSCTYTFTSEQMNQDIPTGASYVDLWLVIYAVFPARDPDTSSEIIHLWSAPFRLWADAASLTTASPPTPTPLAALAGAITGSGLTMATGKLLGRTTAGTGAVEQITVGSGLTLSGGTLSASGGGGGGGGTTVTYAELDWPADGATATFTVTANTYVLAQIILPNAEAMVALSQVARLAASTSITVVASAYLLAADGWKVALWSIPSA